MWSDLRLAELCCVYLDRNLGKIPIKSSIMVVATIIQPLWGHAHGNKAHNNQLTSYAMSLHNKY
jgi:hypothetical protein